MVNNRGLNEFFSGVSANKHVSKKNVLILDEVDGTSGNEDRGKLININNLKSIKLEFSNYTVSNLFDSILFYYFQVVYNL